MVLLILHTADVRLCCGHRCCLVLLPERLFQLCAQIE
jgi:hypothetical protein